MPTLTITNNTSSPVLVQELYASVPASGTLSTSRTMEDVMGMTSFLASVAAGTLSYTITYSTLEKDAGMDQTSESQLYLGVPATASTTAVHAGFAGNNASNTFPGPFTNPDVPRNVTVTFAASWDGGDVTVVGTNQFDEAVTEVIADAAGTTVAGTKIFKTVTSATKQSVGAAADAASIGHGTKMGIPARLGAATGNLLFVTGVSEAGTWDATYDAVTPTSVANGTRSYIVLVKL